MDERRMKQAIEKNIEMIKPEIEIDYARCLEEKNGKKILVPYNVAQELAEKYGVIYSAHLDFFQYQNEHYSNVEEERLKQYVAPVLKKLAIKIRTNRLDEIVKLMKIINLIDWHELNPPHLLNLKNGIYNLDTDTFLRENQIDRSDYLFTHLIDVNYAPGAVSPLWGQTLDQVFDYHGNCRECGFEQCDPDCLKRKEKDKQEKIKSMQEFCGSCLAPGYKSKKALTLYGNTDSGKTTLGKIILNVLGRDVVSAYTLQELGKAKYRAEICNKKANISFDSPKKKFPESRFKSLTGNDRISARKLYRKPFDFQNTCKLILIFNELPKISDRSKATYNRFLILETPNRFVDDPEPEIGHFQKVVDLEEQLLRENHKSAILNWLLEGYKKYMKNKSVTIPASSDEIVENIKYDSSSTYKFIYNYLATGSITKILIKELYAEYENFLVKNGTTKFKVEKRTFCQELRNIGHMRVEGDMFKIYLKNETGNHLFANFKQIDHAK